MNNKPWKRSLLRLGILLALAGCSANTESSQSINASEAAQQVQRTEQWTGTAISSVVRYVDDAAQSPSAKLQLIWTSPASGNSTSTAQFNRDFAVTAPGQQAASGNLTLTMSESQNRFQITIEDLLVPESWLARIPSGTMQGVGVRYSAFGPGVTVQWQEPTSGWPAGSCAAINSEGAEFGTLGYGVCLLPTVNSAEDIAVHRINPASPVVAREITQTESDAMRGLMESGDIDATELHWLLTAFFGEPSHPTMVDERASVDTNLAHDPSREVL